MKKTKTSQSDLQFLTGATVEKKDFFGKSDPFLEFYRLREDNTYVKVLSTEVLKKTLNPVWAILTTTSQVLSNGDLDRPLRQHTDSDVYSRSP